MPPTLDPAAGAALLAWYDRHRRSLPWRAAPGTPADPYRVWLSEIMLQQTTVAAVGPYFDRFTARWPTVEALAAADDAEVMRLWAGLGYYARARNLLATARTVAAAGAFPASAAALRALPGVGEYTAAAIAAIAFGERAVVVDGNVERVMARLTALQTPPKRAKPAVRASVAAMLPADRPGDFAQAMMDLGATICTPTKPACALCPLGPWCAGRGAAERFPVKEPKRPRQDWRGVAFVPVLPSGAVLLRRRPPRGLLGGMPEAFGSPWGKGVAPADDPLAHAPFAAPWREAGAVAHGFTHAVLTVTVHAAQVDAPPNGPALGGGYWDLPAAAGLPTLTRRIVDAALDSLRER